MVGRLVDDTKGTQSFTKLLRDIHKTPTLISREYLISVYAQRMRDVPEEAPRLANRDFDKLAGAGKNAIERKQVDKDINQLLEAVHPIKDLRDERVAHLSANPSSQLPTYAQLDHAINFLVELLNKYSLLVRGIPADTYPTIQGDWRAIFRVPWIASTSAGS